MGLTVGLTGGIASGKSTVAAMLRELGCVVYDADAIVRELYRAGAPGHVALVREYGTRILDWNGEVDRPALSQLALSSPDGAERLNQLIHPLVIEKQRELIAEERKRDPDAIVVVEAALLIESGGRQRFDTVIVVDVSPEIQKERALLRGLTAEEYQRRIDRQLPASERNRHADFVIVNDGSREELQQQVAAVVEQLRKR